MRHPVLELQEAETTADQLKHRRQRLPELDQVTSIRDELARWDASRASMHQRLDELDAEIQRSETESDGIDRHRTRLEAQMKSVIAPREAEALQREITTLTERRSDLDDAELASIEEQSRLEDDLRALLGQEESLRASMTAAEAALAVAQSDIDNELAGIAARLDGLRAEVDADVLARYDRLRAQFVVAATTLAGSRCEGCHLDLSAHEVDDVKDEIAAHGVGDCPQCGRILVR